MYNPTVAYFEDEDILARVQFLDELASDYFEAGYSEEEADAYEAGEDPCIYIVKLIEP